MTIELRKLVRYAEETFIEGGRAAPKPLKLFGVAAVVRNPWAGAGFVEDLRPQIAVYGPALGELLTDRKSVV